MFRILILLMTVFVVKVKNEAFSSTANLIQLVQSEEMLAQSLEAYIQNEENRLSEIKGYINEIRMKNTSNDELFYAGHPVNAYNLIKRWHRLSSMTPNTPSYDAVTSQLQGLPLPSEDDFLGAAAALLRLQRTFSLETDDIAAGKIFSDGGAEKLAADDFVAIGKVAIKNADYGLAAQWMLKALDEPKDDIPNASTFTDLSTAYKGMGDFDTAVYYAKLALETNPGDAGLDQAYNALRIQADKLREREPPTEAKVTPQTWQRFLPKWRVNYEGLCRGEPDKTQDPEFAKNLVCRYKPGKLPYVTYKEEILSWDPRIGMFYDVISDEEAEMIKEKAYPMLQRAEVGEEEALVIDGRISKVAWLWDEDQEIKHLSERVEDITGLETEYRNPLSSAEPFQVVNYGIGGQYEPHHDFYENKSAIKTLEEADLKDSGDRLGTFLFYLTDIKHGGATVFPRINIRVPPVKNAAAFWYNAKLSGEFDKDTEHAGCPVLLGQKWVSNKWIRELGQEFRRRCALSPDAIDMS